MRPDYETILIFLETSPLITEYSKAAALVFHSPIHRQLDLLIALPQAVAAAKLLSSLHIDELINRLLYSSYIIIIIIIK